VIVLFEAVDNDQIVIIVVVLRVADTIAVEDVVVM
jgi:hypothetical protein